MPDILTTKQAAAYLQLSSKVLGRLTNARIIPCVRLNSRVRRFRKSTLDAWLAKKEK